MLEQQVLANSGFEVKHFEAFSQLMPGARRALAIYPGDVKVTADPLGVRVAFSLPPGAYATTVLAEFVDASPDEATEDGQPTNVE